jgi:tripartite-type tricarboxylate transporter receptor subunit TctC
MTLTQGKKGSMRLRTLVLITAALLACFTASAEAQTFPSKPVTIIVPFAAGGPSDVLVRTLAERMRVTLKETVVIENVTGAGGTIGVTRAVRSPADGYTISFGHLGTHVVNGAIYPLPFDLVEDFDPVTLLGANPMLVVSKTAIPAKTLKELIDWLKANQNQATLGTAGVGSGAHFSGVYFQNLIGSHASYVPYRGTGPALQDLVAGQIDIIVDQASNSLPQVQAGSIRAYAVTDTKRIAAAPDVPTVDEAGLPGFHVSLWSGLWVPKGTPKDIVAKLNETVRAALDDPAVRKRYAELGLEQPAQAQRTPEALRAHQKAEVAKWWPVIKAANVKP